MFELTTAPLYQIQYSGFGGLASIKIQIIVFTVIAGFINE